MNEEIEYAEMLEIPVSTVNIVRKNQRRKKVKNESAQDSAPNPFPTFNPPLKDSLIEQVNSRISETPEQSEPILADEPIMESVDAIPQEGHLQFDDIPERIDTVRLYSAEETGVWGDALRSQDDSFKNENEGGRYAFNRKNGVKFRLQTALNIEFVAACALCGAIFLTNVFMPTSAINTFFRSIHSASSAAADTRHYTDFTLTPVVSELSETELSLSPTGILSFTDEGCVYPAANGKVAGVTQNTDGSYTVKIAHSDTFTGVFNGLDFVYYAVGDEVKANVPLGYTSGKNEVQVTMYSGGALLNCFELTEANCLTWVEAAQ